MTTRESQLVAIVHGAWRVEASGSPERVNAHLTSDAVNTKARSVRLEKSGKAQDSLRAAIITMNVVTNAASARWNHSTL